MYGNRDLKPETSVTERSVLFIVMIVVFRRARRCLILILKNKLTSYDIGTKDPVTGLNTFIYDNVGEANIRGWSLQLRFLCMINGMYLQTIHLLTLVRKSDDESLNGKSLKGNLWKELPDMQPMQNWNGITLRILHFIHL